MLALQQLVDQWHERRLSAPQGPLARKLRAIMDTAQEIVNGAPKEMFHPRHHIFFSSASRLQQSARDIPHERMAVDRIRFWNCLIV